jgi:hypothetical protein
MAVMTDSFAPEHNGQSMNSSSTAPEASTTRRKFARALDEARRFEAQPVPDLNSADRRTIENWLVESRMNLEEMVYAMSYRSVEEFNRDGEDPFRKTHVFHPRVLTSSEGMEALDVIYGLIHNSQYLRARLSNEGARNPIKSFLKRRPQSQ